MRITTEWLQAQRACRPVIFLFAEEWPDGAELNVENLVRAAELGLPWHQIIPRILELERWLEVERIRKGYIKIYCQEMDEIWHPHQELLYHITRDVSQPADQMEKLFNRALDDYAKAAAELTKRHETNLAYLLVNAFEQQERDTHA